MGWPLKRSTVSIKIRGLKPGEASVYAPHKAVDRRPRSENQQWVRTQAIAKLSYGENY
ncbi:MAG: hypothetical protein MJA27_27640 [Pseudanabaenales cyanobacterium]|nr:hypothetical protein [Pseudanabaenales cyanobacterium]